MERLTIDEVKKIFPIGSIAEVIDNENYEFICSLGEKVKILDFLYVDGYGCLVRIQMLKNNNTTDLYHWRLKSCNTIGNIKCNSSCPNCNGELVDKYSDWAGKEIKKCKSCGWC